jgi:selenocysteine lyase/cysteine desulfurase
LDRVTEHTKVIAVSWVQYQTGSVTDLEYLSKQLSGKGIWLVADVIQGVGVRPFDFHNSGFDIVCGGGHKWLCSNYGVGFMAVKKSRMNQMIPLEFGAMTYGNPDTRKSFEIQPKISAARYEPGSKSMVETIALIETLRLFSEMGMQNIFNEASRLADRLREGLKSLGFKTFCTDGPIVNFTSNDSDLNALAQKLKEAQISFALRGPGLRLSVHAFNHDSEIEKILEVLRPR